MSGSKTDLKKMREKALEASAREPAGGDYVWDGTDEEERPLSRAEMEAGLRKGGRP